MHIHATYSEHCLVPNCGIFSTVNGGGFLGLGGQVIPTTVLAMVDFKSNKQIPGLLQILQKNGNGTPFGHFQLDHYHILFTEAAHLYFLLNFQYCRMKEGQKCLSQEFLNKISCF